MSDNKLLYNGNEFDMDTDPLFQYYKHSQFVNSQKKDLKKTDDISFVKNKEDKEFLEQQQRFCSLGFRNGFHISIIYCGKWEIKENKLYLVDFYGYNADREKVGMDYLYPNQKEVFVEWFTGEIRVSIGENHSFYNRNEIIDRVKVISEEYMHFNFTDGILISSNVVDNKKNIADEYRRKVYEKSQISFGPNIENYPRDFRSLYENAINFYNKLLEFYPLYAKAYLYIGEANHAKHDFENAINNYQKAIEIEPSFSEPYLKLAYMYSNKHELEYYNFDLAIIFFKKTLEIDPTAHNVYCSLGHLYVSKGDFDEAISSYQNAIIVGTKIKSNGENRNINFNGFFDSDLDNYTYNLSKTYKEKSKILSESRLIDSQSDILSNRIRKVYIELGDMYSEQNDFNDAINCYQKSIEFVRTLEMTDKDLSNTLIGIYRELMCCVDYEKALFYCEEALKIFPEDKEDFQYQILDIYSNIGNDYSNKEDHTLAFDYYKKAFDLGLEYSNKSLAIGNTYLKNNDFINAISNYSKAVDIDIIYTYNLFYLGSTLYDVGNYVDALNSLKVAIKICARYVDIFNRILNTKGIYNDPQIVGILNEFLEHKDSLQAEIVGAYFLLGHIYVTQKKYFQAISNYYSAINIDYGYLNETHKSLIVNKDGKFCFFVALIASSLALKNIKTIIKIKDKEQN